MQEFKGQVAQFVLMFYKAKNLAFKAVYLLDGHSSKPMSMPLALLSPLPQRNS